MSARRARRYPSWPLAIIAVPAGIAIWSGWVGIGEMTGFGLVNLLPGIVKDHSWSTLNTAITLPVGVETYAAYAMGAWLSGSGIPKGARTFARWSGIGSLLLGAAGQGAYHLMKSLGVVKAPWPIVVIVSCLPVLTLGMAAALAHLLHTTEPEESTGPEHAQEQPEVAPEHAQVPTAPLSHVAPEQAVASPLDTSVAPAQSVPASGQLTPDFEHAQNTPDRRGQRTSGLGEIVRRAVAEHPGASIGELVSLTNASRSTVRRYRSEVSTPEHAQAASMSTPAQPRINGNVPALTGPEVTP